MDISERTEELMGKCQGLMSNIDRAKSCLWAGDNDNAIYYLERVREELTDTLLETRKLQQEHGTRTVT